MIIMPFSIEENYVFYYQHYFNYFNFNTILIPSRTRFSQ